MKRSNPIFSIYFSFLFGLFIILCFTPLHAQAYFLNAYKILGIGSPCLDTILEVDDKLFKEIEGSKGGSSSISLEAFERILNGKNKNSLKQITGGSCLNTLKGLSQLNIKCALLGRIGCDEASKIIQESLQSHDIEPLFTVSKLPTAQILCLVTDDKERTMRSLLGASLELSEADLDPKYFEGVKMVHIEGYTLYNKNLTKKSIELAKKAGAKVSFDMGSFELVRKYKNEILAILNQVDILFGNTDEYAALTDLPPEKAAEKIALLGPTAVVLSGPKGCFVGCNDTVIHSLTEPVTPIDTTGAGDLFISGFLSGYIEGKPLRECAIIGNLLGRSVIQTLGAEIGQSKWDEIKKEINYEAKLTIN